ncbi:hypothetical protein Vretimale_12166 [Volvox reticuliferus]|nr:hypothetical protein Vretimale_12166 [Volvox reticuliferus]
MVKPPRADVCMPTVWDGALMQGITPNVLSTGAAKLALFARQPQPVSKPTRTAEAKTKPSLLSNTTAQNILIQFKAVTRPAQFRVALEQMDHSVLSATVVTQCLGGYPKEEDMANVREWCMTNDPRGLDEAEQFVRVLDQVPHAKLRLEVLHVRHHFDEDLARKTQLASAIKSACDGLLGSFAWRKLLKELLAFGNELNKHRAQQEPAVGFKASSLCKIADMKTFDGSWSMLEIVVESMLIDGPHGPRHVNELILLEGKFVAAGAVDVKVLLHDAAEMQKSINVVKKFLDCLRQDEAQTDGARLAADLTREWTELLNRWSGDYRTLSDNVRAAMASLREAGAMHGDVWPRPRELAAAASADPSIAAFARPEIREWPVRHGSQFIDNVKCFLGNLKQAATSIRGELNRWHQFCNEVAKLVLEDIDQRRTHEAEAITTPSASASYRQTGRFTRTYGGGFRATSPSPSRSHRSPSPSPSTMAYTGCGGTGGESDEPEVTSPAPPTTGKKAAKAVTAKAISAKSASTKELGRETADAGGGPAETQTAAELVVEGDSGERRGNDPGVDGKVLSGGRRKTNESIGSTTLCDGSGSNRATMQPTLTRQGSIEAGYTAAAAAAVLGAVVVESGMDPLAGEPSFVEMVEMVEGEEDNTCTESGRLRQHGSVGSTNGWDGFSANENKNKPPALESETSESSEPGSPVATTCGSVSSAISAFEREKSIGRSVEPLSRTQSDGGNTVAVAVTGCLPAVVSGGADAGQDSPAHSGEVVHDKSASSTVLHAGAQAMDTQRRAEGKYDDGEEEEDGGEGDEGDEDDQVVVPLPPVLVLDLDTFFRLPVPLQRKAAGRLRRSMLMGSPAGGRGEVDVRTHFPREEENTGGARVTCAAGSVNGRVEGDVAMLLGQQRIKAIFPAVGRGGLSGDESDHSRHRSSLSVAAGSVTRYPRRHPQPSPARREYERQLQEEQQRQQQQRCCVLLTSKRSLPQVLQRIADFQLPPASILVTSAGAMLWRRCQRRNLPALHVAPSLPSITITLDGDDGGLTGDSDGGEEDVYDTCAFAGGDGNGSPGAIASSSSEPLLISRCMSWTMPSRMEGCNAPLPPRPSLPPGAVQGGGDETCGGSGLTGLCPHIAIMRPPPLALPPPLPPPPPMSTGRSRWFGRVEGHSSSCGGRSPVDIFAARCSDHGGQFGSCGENGLSEGDGNMPWQWEQDERWHSHLQRPSRIVGGAEGCRAPEFNDEVRAAIEFASQHLPAGALGPQDAATFHLGQQVRRSQLEAFRNHVTTELRKLPVKVHMEVEDAEDVMGRAAPHRLNIPGGLPPGRQHLQREQERDSDPWVKVHFVPRHAAVPLAVRYALHHILGCMDYDQREGPPTVNTDEELRRLLQL